MREEHAMVARAFGEMGLSFRAVFPDPLDQLGGYGAHRWEVVKTKHHHAVHAIPPADQFDNSFWEMWALGPDGDPVHHVMFLSPPPVPYHDILDLKHRKEPHMPKDVCGHRWFVVQESAMFAWGVKHMLRAR